VAAAAGLHPARLKCPKGARTAVECASIWWQPKSLLQLEIVFRTLAVHAGFQNHSATGHLYRATDATAPAAWRSTVIRRASSRVNRLVAERSDAAIRPGENGSARVGHEPTSMIIVPRPISFARGRRATRYDQKRSRRVPSRMRKLLI
jgi:hypothetical protein